MNLISRDTDYALRALCCISGKGKKVVSVNELVKDLKIPRPFLRKILQKLNKHCVLKSYKGKGGGFELCLDPADIFLVDIIKVFQGPICIQEHIFKKRRCVNMKTCVLKKKLDEIERFVIDKLSSINIPSLVKDI